MLVPKPTPFAVAVSGLEKLYGRLHAVDRVSFEVEPGEIFGIIGANGSGKTTTVECLQGLRPRPQRRDAEEQVARKQHRPRGPRLSRRRPVLTKDHKNLCVSAFRPALVA